MKTKVLKAVLSAVEVINLQLPEDQRLEPSRDAEIFGAEGKLDSLRLIGLIVEIEQNIEAGLGTTINLADERAMARKESPFRTVGTLVDYIDEVLREKTGD